MSSLSEAKQVAHDWIDQNRQRLSDFDLEIWRYAEPAWREYRSAKAYVDLLRDEGFDVEEGSGDMPTAFAASWGTRGPVIGSYAEHDAVPGNSQQSVPYQRPARACTCTQPGTPTRIPCWVSARSPGSWPRRRRWRSSAHRGAAPFLRARGEGLRLETGPRCQGLL